MADSSKSAKDLQRELGELLNEIRVALPGVQVLFAFLLTVPFSQRFGRLDSSDRLVYFVAFLSAAVASVLLIAPTSYARLTWRQKDKDRLLNVSNRLVIAGCAFIAIGLGAVVYLVTIVIYASTAAAIAVALVMTLLGLTWYVLPLTDRLRRRPPVPKGSS
jgi:amino acid transporter